MRVPDHRRAQLGIPLPHVHNVHLHRVQETQTCQAPSRRTSHGSGTEAGAGQHSGSLTLPEEDEQRRHWSLHGLPGRQPKQDEADARRWMLEWFETEEELRRFGVWLWQTSRYRNRGTGGCFPGRLVWMLGFKSRVCSADWFVYSLFFRPGAATCSSVSPFLGGAGSVVTSDLCCQRLSHLPCARRWGWTRRDSLRNAQCLLPRSTSHGASCSLRGRLLSPHFRKQWLFLWINSLDAVEF
jgi:hypothetical protein